MIMDRRISSIIVRSSSLGIYKKYSILYESTYRGQQSVLSEIKIGGNSVSDISYKFTYQGQNPSEEGFQKVSSVSNLWPLNKS